ncbi:MAG: parallel beta-helix domain-containing protein [Bacteroidia bacterium]|nr:right-handed parallel beta-helix repeat-containing protein [Bacteroidia bacterium]MDW8332788.1 parallel beta-helix domain-containing protein [Bacteroidia bacterium]
MRKTTLAFLLLLTACKKQESEGPKIHVIQPGPDAQARAQEAMLDVRPGEIIEFAAGEFHFNNTLSIVKKENVTVRGRGKDATVLVFKDAARGAEGIRGTELKHFMIRDLTVRDPKGDGIKIKDSEGVTFFNVHVEWTAGPDSTNGAYGLYPVACKNLVLDGCSARGASDAGIYVGQCSSVVVRNCEARENVAGIEIENTVGADVYLNRALHNTGGILIFDLPNLPVKNGERVRVFRNEIRDNNTPNFAPAGNIVAQVPAGTGIMIMSMNDVEVFDNDVIDCAVMGTGVVNYQSLSLFDPGMTITDPEFGKETYAVHVHDNRYSRSRRMPLDKPIISGMLKMMFADTVPDILFDGFLHPGAADDPSKRVCIRNNAGASFANLNVPGGLTVSRDLSAHDCSHPPLGEISVSAPRP